MSRKASILIGALAASIAGAAVVSVTFGGQASDEAPGDDPGAANGAHDEPPLSREPGESDEALAQRQRSAREAMLDREYPMHGLVTAAQLVVRAEPELRGRDGRLAPAGWAQCGSRLGADARTSTCNDGLVRGVPAGLRLRGAGHRGGRASHQRSPAEDQSRPTSESALPYRYMLVREPQVPEYHQLPSRDQQRAAIAHGQRYAELLNAGEELRAQNLRAGRLAGEPPMPSAVARYLQRGFYVASNGTEVRSRRRFARTVRGSYVKEAQLIETTGSEFAGVELGGEGEGGVSLPIAFALRASRPLIRRVSEDGTERFVADEEMEAWERQTRVPWIRRQRYGDQIYHVLEGSDGEERFLRAWFVGVAEPREPPSGIESDDEPWVHVDLSEQTLVLYRGATPVYATLVSSGIDGHATPTGEFTIRRKFISDTMANLGPDAADDNYRIDDVPWTQYFDGSIALHGAFWHHRFGLERSHGCVNLAPHDARRVFQHTWPEIPEGWHGVSTERGAGFSGSRVVVTE